MRYFTDKNTGTIWRWDGKTLEGRTVNSDGWSKSLFNNPADLMENLNGIREIPEP